MKTKIKQQGNIVVISMNGHLDFETSEPLKEDLTRIIDQSKTDSVPKKIIFNLENLEFVGSSGISSFVQTLKTFNQMAPIRPRYCNVRSEFQRIIKAYDNEEFFEFYDDEDSALQGSS